MRKDITGERFGKLVAIREVEPLTRKNGYDRQRYLCKCDCGCEKVIMKEHLTGGNIRSCGCARKESKLKTHGDIKSRLYKIWGNMRNRCSNENNPAYHNYGARGIAVCKEWDSYESFREWAYSNGYNDDLTLDRIDNDAGYSPDNCRWANVYEQANNKRNNVIIEYNGEVATMSEWAKILGIPYKVLYARLNRSMWSVEKAFTQPVR